MDTAVTPPRSTFVTAVAWVFIVLSGFTTFISVLQNLMLRLVFPKDAMQQLAQQQAPPGMPPFFALMQSHFLLFFGAFLVFSLIMLTASIGLLRRWNWARLLFIGLLGLGILWNLGGLVMQFGMADYMQHAVPNTPDAEMFHTMLIVMRVFGVLMALAFSGLFAWIIKRLVSAPVVAEFRR